MYLFVRNRLHALTHPHTQHGISVGVPAAAGAGAWFWLLLESPHAGPGGPVHRAPECYFGHPAPGTACGWAFAGGAAYGR